MKKFWKACVTSVAVILFSFVLACLVNVTLFDLFPDVAVNLNTVLELTGIFIFCVVFRASFHIT